ncbi:hypothetical protein [Actinomadura parmotrematis]|uniref:Uncharacterized protein n=1 Tax=Actinomadura parmotrematis TaxID=2864039 RepID=A0ABS7FUM1_9ACTN|nr:hypothetical protein [Actinomadura parmotrematis]MBW8484108.1 hypothetical protein [Actinomadura parmotrematis]
MPGVPALFRSWAQSVADHRQQAPAVGGVAAQPAGARVDAGPARDLVQRDRDALGRERLASGGEPALAAGNGGNELPRHHR